MISGFYVEHGMPVVSSSQLKRARKDVCSRLRQEKCKWRTHECESTEPVYGRGETGTE